MRVVALCRVSTDLQANRGASLDAQERRANDLAASQGWNLVALFRFQESGAKRDRPVFEEVLAYIRSHPEVEAVWCYELSRLSRGDRHDITLLMRELQERGVRVIVDTTVYDLADPSSSLPFELLSVMGNWEWRLLKARTDRGRREKAMQGKRAVGAAPYGYINPPVGDPRHGILQPHPERAAVVRRIFASIAAGVSTRRLVEQLDREGIPSPRGGRWAKATIAMILANRAYLGIAEAGVFHRQPGSSTFRRNRQHPRAIIVEGAHEPLVTPEEWEAAQRMRRPGTGQPSLLTGLLRIDGREAFTDKARGRRVYRSKGGGPGAPVELVDGMVWEGFLGLASRPEALSALFRRMRSGGEAEGRGDDEAALEGRLTRLRARLSRLVDMRSEGEIDKATFAEKRAEVEGQIRSLEQSIATVRRRRDETATPRQDRELAAAAVLLGGKLSPEARRNTLRGLVAQIDMSLMAGEPRRQNRGGKLTKKTYPTWRPESILLRLAPPGEQSCTPSGHSSWKLCPKYME